MATPVIVSFVDMSRVAPQLTHLWPQSNGLLYSSVVIGTLAVDGRTITFNTARRAAATESTPTVDDKQSFSEIIGPTLDKLPSDITDQQRHQIVEFLQEYDDMFSRGTFDVTSHGLDGRTFDVVIMPPSSSRRITC